MDNSFHWMIVQKAAWMAFPHDFLPKAWRDWPWFIQSMLYSCLSSFSLSQRTKGSHFTQKHLLWMTEQKQWFVFVLGADRQVYVSHLWSWCEAWCVEHCPMCLFVSCTYTLRLDALPSGPVSHAQAGHLLEGHSRPNRWVNDLLERQETEIIRSPLRGSHYQGPPSGSSCCFTYYLSSTLACAAQRSGCASRQLCQIYQFQH